MGFVFVFYLAGGGGGFIETADFLLAGVAFYHLAVFIEDGHEALDVVDVEPHDFVGIDFGEVDGQHVREQVQKLDQ